MITTCSIGVAALGSGAGSALATAQATPAAATVADAPISSARPPTIRGPPPLGSLGAWRARATALTNHSPGGVVKSDEAAEPAQREAAGGNQERQRAGREDGRDLALLAARAQSRAEV